MSNAGEAGWPAGEGAAVPERRLPGGPPGIRLLSGLGRGGAPAGRGGRQRAAVQGGALQEPEPARLAHLLHPAPTPALRVGARHGVRQRSRPPPPGGSGTPAAPTAPILIWLEPLLQLAPGLHVQCQAHGSVPATVGPSPAAAAPTAPPAAA